MKSKSAITAGDPSAFEREGEVVLDLGSGAERFVHRRANSWGAGRVIGIEANNEMLALANKHRQSVGDRIGYRNVEFRKGRIHDLRFDLALVDSYLAKDPVASVADFARFNDYCAMIKTRRLLVSDESVGLVLSNCSGRISRSNNLHGS